MRLIIVDPAHFHAALLQREMYQSVDSRAEVFAPVGPEVIDYLTRVTAFHSRPQNPTRWDLDLHLSAAPLAPMEDLLRGKAGDVAVFTGRNRPKIDRILGALRAGLHVLADKPWIIESGDLPKLQEALELADIRKLIAFDIMTERYEVTSQLQREFVSHPEVFGAIETGSGDSPGIRARSVHHLMKMVAGVSLKRPAWFFDIGEYGEALADVGTHVVDLVEWTGFANCPAIDPAADIGLIAGGRWPVHMTAEQFRKVTGTTRDGDLDYYCNNSVHYTWRGVHVHLEITWEWEAVPGGGDIYEAAFRGTKALVEIRQGAAEHHRPEVYLAPTGATFAELRAAVQARVAQLQTRWPGLSVMEGKDDLRLAIPEEFRVGHEAHFAQVANRFFECVAAPERLPAWERPNMIAKYTVTTGGVDLGRRG